MEDVAPRAAPSWIPAALWALTIFVASSVPARDIPHADAIFGHDKLIHAAVYTLLAVLVFRGRVGIVLTVLIVSAFGVTDELHQLLTPGRDCSVLDWTADSVGALAGVGLSIAWSKYATALRKRKTLRHGHHP